MYHSFSQAEIQNPNSAVGLYWRVKGNASTDTSQNFLGTTDANYMTISTNNVRRMTIDTGGRVGIGTTTPNLLGMMEVVNTIGTNTGIIISNYGSPNELWFRRANGNIAVPTIVGTGGSLARIDGRGYDGSTYLQAARIEMLVDSTSGLGQMTGRVIFSTAPAGSAPVERVRINRNGLMGIGTTAPATRLDVNGDLAIRQASLTLANGVNNNVAISPFPNGNSYYRITGPSAAFSITGLLASGDGRIVVLQNSTTQVMTLKDQATSSNLTARIMTGGGDLAIGDSGTVTLIYSNTDNRWQVQAFTNGTLANGTFGNAWSIIGNSGLNNAINFLGTSDNADVIIKRQNEEALRVYPGGALVGIGNTATGLVPVSGFGTRFLWAPAKNAIRAGSVNGAQWDNANVGNGSAAFGNNNTAFGSNSFSAGADNFSTGSQGATFGNQNIALGTSSFATGNSDTATGNLSVVFGIGNRAFSYAEISGGTFSTTYVASSTTSFNANDRVFNIGNGTASNARSDAFTVLKGGNIGIGISTPAQRLHINGVNSTIRVGGLATGAGYNSIPASSPYNLVVADNTGDFWRLPNPGGVLNNYVLTMNGAGSPVWNPTVPNAWSLTGNAGTVAGTNFIGTTDNVSLRFRTNNLDRMTIDNSGRVGVGTTTPHSRLHTEGSFAAAYAVASSSTYTLTDNDHTVRRFGACNTIVFPDATTCKGRIYFIINSNGTGSNVGLSTTSPQIIYDDVTNTIITFIAPNERIQVQSDGSDWIVIGR